MHKNEGDYSIGAVERDTGIGRDTLRVWERRYGFPVPQRNAKGERVYSEEQLRRLQRIRRLLSQGLRPGKILPLDESALTKVEQGLKLADAEAVNENVAAIIEMVRSSDVEQFEALLRRQYESAGMPDFINNTVVPLLTRVGELWASGELQIYQEHFLSQQLLRFLNIEIAKLQTKARKPLVLLATLPGEQHSLGLLLVSAMLSYHHVSIVNLGSEVPVDQIVKAAEHFNADIVGVTFSSAYQYSNIRSHIIELREQISEGVDIWMGGEGARRLRKLPPGVTKVTCLDKLPV